MFILSLTFASDFSEKSDSDPGLYKKNVYGHELFKKLDPAFKDMDSEYPSNKRVSKGNRKKVISFYYFFFAASLNMINKQAFHDAFILL